MKKSTGTLISIAIIGLLSSFTIMNDWVVFKRDNCKILFPGKPTSDSTVTDTKLGKVTVYTHMYESPENSVDSNVAYGLIITDYPPAFILSSDSAFLKGFFDGAIKGAVGNINGKLLAEKDILINNYRGKEIKIDYGNGVAVFTMKMILVKASVFGLQTIALTGKEDNANAASFYNSFEIQ